MNNEDDTRKSDASKFVVLPADLLRHAAAELNAGSAFRQRASYRRYAIYALWTSLITGLAFYFFGAEEKHGVPADLDAWMNLLAFLALAYVLVFLPLYLLLAKFINSTNKRVR